ncbi:TetR/AcrR family transcriptional regulator [Hymenobacter sp. BT175]|uniref:TetR/AcrR family transcriptional regulator n=1 Tax=Hymenobacter TaxID=89966 RepID=UPI0016510D8F|nr:MULTISPECIES: TetR/AcrR family transcriptional regulator [Hymenobacter]MBC6700269.1 TetR/AcrR family transcriptional regulator [Hymenobacter sp. BT190]MCC2548725.1 TetR/AcrR family transcriptional regulator [Hymenobacter translucens]MCR5890519.1 TetR/AcrR family transcriptional regulator [Hymenobacter sp. J193]MCR5890616.1 TetR/AcrR family transcriptional regulator [Hymenobacter sp. J193]
MSRPQEFDTTEALHQAMRAFWRKGYEATSLTDLLAATGLSKSSLYATFGGKRDLFLAAFDAYRQARARDAHRVLQQQPARRAIETFFHSLFADVNSNEPLLGCMSINQAVELAPHDPAVRQRVVEDLQQMEEVLTQAIERGQQDGSVASPRPARELARLLVLAFPGLQVMARAGYRRQQLDDAQQLLFTCLDR